MWRSLIVGFVLGLACVVEVSAEGNAGKGKVAAKQTQILVNQGEEIGIDCNPDKNAKEVDWQIGGEDINLANEPENKFSFGPSNGTATGKLTINSVEYTDRNDYTCVITFCNATEETSNTTCAVTKEFRLRVRDPLGALWPTIGVVVEAVALFVIIVACESYAKKSKST